MTARSCSFPIATGGPDAHALWQRPRGARATYVLAHGAGAGMEHPFMAALANGLSARKIATLRFAFPYMQSGRRRPDAQRVLRATVVAAVADARARARGLPLFAGGKSMGGRMTSRAVAAGALVVDGLAFVGFPLHPAGKPAISRADHLSDVQCPLLFVQGTRDRLARLDLLRSTVARLPRARLHLVRDGDHGFGVRVRSGRRAQDVMDEIADVLAAWFTRA